MKRRSLRASSLIAAGLVSFHAAFTVVHAQPGGASSPKTRQQTFEVVWKTVNEGYFDPAFGGVDWAEIRRRYLPQLADVKNDGALYELLSAMLNELPVVSHLGIVRPEDLNTAFTSSVLTTGLTLRDIDGQIVITRVRPGSPAEEAGLRPGFGIARVDDIAVMSSRDAEERLGRDTQTHRVIVTDEDGIMRAVALANRLPPADMLALVRLTRRTRWYALLDSTRLVDGIGYIEFTNFVAPLKTRLLEAVASMHDAPGLIIDLRGNAGGSDEVGLALAGRLLGQETQLAIVRTRTGDDYHFKTKRQHHPYLRPVVMLLDEQSGSESEQVAVALQERGRVVVIGKRSHGAGMAGVGKELPTGAILIYPAGQSRTPKGVVIEGRGVIPNIEVSLTREELLKGRDAQLETAIAYLRQLTSF